MIVSVRINTLTSCYVLLATMVKFSQLTYRINEYDGSAKFTLTLSNPSSFDIIVQVLSMDGSATGKYASILVGYLTYVYHVIGEGADYGSGPYNVTFTGGATEGHFNVTINDDSILEGNENFNLTIMASSLPSRVNIGNPAQATVTIVDNDGNYIIYPLLMA